MMINPVHHPEVKPRYLSLQSSKWCCHFGRLCLGKALPNDGGAGFGTQTKLLQANRTKTVFIGKCLSPSQQGQGCFCGDLPGQSRNTTTIQNQHNDPKALSKQSWDYSLDCLVY